MAVSCCSWKPLAGEMGDDPIGVQRQDGQLGGRPADEAVDEQEILRLLGSQQVLRTIPRRCAERQPGSDLEPRARPRREGANRADAPAADEEGFPPARLGHRSDQTDLEPAEPVEPGQALDDVIERVDPISQSRCFFVTEAFGEV